MGRRSDMENEERPIEEKLVEVVASSDFRGMKFGDIVELAGKVGISRATVARYLADLVKRNIIKKDDAYRLAMEALHWKHAQRSLFSILAMHLFDDVFEKAGQGKLSEEEFTTLFTRRVGVLAMYTMVIGLSKAQGHPEEGGKWIEEAFGTLIQKDGWRMCLNRQIFGGVVKLNRPIKLEQPLTPEIVVEDETIYVHPPSAIRPGLAGKVLKELPAIQNDKLNLLRGCLKNLYPKETEILDNALDIIEQAAAQSKRR